METSWPRTLKFHHMIGSELCSILPVSVMLIVLTKYVKAAILNLQIVGTCNCPNLKLYPLTLLHSKGLLDTQTHKSKT